MDGLVLLSRFSKSVEDVCWLHNDNRQCCLSQVKHWVDGFTSVDIVFSVSTVHCLPSKGENILKAQFPGFLGTSSSSEDSLGPSKRDEVLSGFGLSCFSKSVLTWFQVFLCVQVYGAPPVMTSIGSFHQVAEVNPLQVEALSDIVARVKRSPVPFRSFGRGRGRGHHGRGRGWGRGRGGRGRPFGGNNFGSTLTAGAIGFGAGFLANGLFGWRCWKCSVCHSSNRSFPISKGYCLSPLLPKDHQVPVSYWILAWFVNSP